MRGRAVAGATGRALRGSSADAARALRSLRRSPAFTGAVSLTLAIGIGANATVFGVVDRVLFTPPPYAEPQSLVLVWHTLGRSADRFRVPAPDAAELERRSGAFDEVAFLTRTSDGAVEASDGRGVEHVRWAAATPDLMAVLGVQPTLGAAFTGDPAEGGEIVLSHGTWRSTFAADAGVVGRTTRLNGRPVRVVGVMPPDFRVELPPAAGMGGAPDVWLRLGVPLESFARTDGREIDQDSDNTGAVVARLRSGVSIEEASGDVGRVAAELRLEIPEYAASSRDAVVRPMHEDATAHLRGLLTLLLVAVAAVLVASCLSVSTLVVARGERRRSELAVRSALGAGDGALLRQLVVEAIVLVSIGIVASLVIAYVGARTASQWVPPELGLGTELPVDPPTFAVAALIALGSTLAFSLAPAVRLLRAGTNGRLGAPIATTLRDSGRVRGALVATEVAVSVVLVFATALLVRAADELRNTDLGFDPHGALTFALSLRLPDRYTGPAERARLMRRIETELRSLPNVEAVGLTAHLPLGGREWTQPYGLPGRPASQSTAEGDDLRPGHNRADFRTVTSGYFDALGARIVRGRAFRSDEDLVEDRRVVIIDDLLAERFVGEGRGTVLGATLSLPLDGAIVEAEVVGVVDHVRHRIPETEPRETLYVPYRQEASRDVSVVVRTGRDPLELAPAVRRTLLAIDRDIPVHGLRTLSAYVDAAVAPTRFVAAVIAVFAALVLLSVAVGLYGVVSLEVARRTRDIGVRIAVGAGRGAVLRSVLLRGLRLTAAGAMAGLVVAAALERLSEAGIVGASKADAGVWSTVLFAVLAVSLLASWVPAHRASKLDPTVALKSD